MRIAYFTESLPPLTDGVSRTLSELRKSLISEGHEFIFFSPFAPEPDAWERKVIEIISVPFPFYTKYRFSLPFFHDIRCHLDKFKPDLVHICSPFLLGMAAYDYARSVGIPAVNSYHTRFVSYLKYYGHGWFEPFGWRYLRWFYNQADLNFIPSIATIDELRSRGFKNLALWERGIDTSRFSPVFADLDLRRRWSPDGDPIAIFVGRLVREKDIEILIDAYHILIGRGIKLRLVFVGEGPMRDEIAQQLPDAVMAGFLEGSELARAYASADIFAFPSTTESFGNVVLEAGASGLPSVVAAEGGVMNLVVDGITGYIARPKDAIDFADKMAPLLKDNLLRNALGTKAIEHVSKKSWKNTNNSLFENYSKLLRGSSMNIDSPLREYAKL
jgi:glycosyltransferase involved in cell wall biosynthesis